jgi:hypothetical protein
MNWHSWFVFLIDGWFDLVTAKKRQAAPSADHSVNGAPGFRLVNSIRHKQA